MDVKTADELTDIVITVVQREPTEPSGLGMVAIITSLFRQFAEQEVQAERRRCVEVADRLRRNATCKTVKKTCGAIIDRIVAGE